MECRPMPDVLRELIPADRLRRRLAEADAACGELPV